MRQRLASAMQHKVYKIFIESEWLLFKETGLFKGSADDLRDGFIHLSTEEQVDGVIKRFFFGQKPLYVADFSTPDFLKRLTWEQSSSGGIYPHLYNSDLHVGDIIGFVKL